jgi:hypothetical protein
MEALITTECDVWIIYDSNDSNKVIGMLDDSLDKDVHDSLNPDNIKISTNKLNSPAGEVLYLEQVQVNSDGLASKV